MIAYKLFRVLKNGSITSLFINKKERLKINEWLNAKEYPTKGYVFRPQFHCTSKPYAPHLSMKNRKWFKIEMKEYTEIRRPKSQGGLWYLANKIKIIEELKDEKV